MLKLILYLIVSLTLLSGCSTSRVLLSAQDAYKNYDLDEANTNIKKFIQNNPGQRNILIAHLELGSILLTQDKLLEARQAFRKADAIIKEQDLEPEISLSQEFNANFTNLNALTYRASSYDKLMVSTYLALINLKLNNQDASRAHLFNAFERQQDAVFFNANRIENAIEARENDKHKNIPAFSDAQQIEKIQSRYSELDEFTHYTNYINPFTEFLQAMYFLHCSAERNDFERSRVSFKRLEAITDNRYITQDLTRTTNAIAGKKLKPVTYVIFETGTAPSRGEIRISLPLFLVSENVTYFSVTFPKLKMNKQYQGQLNISIDQADFQTQLLCNMDAVVGTEFKNELPVVITKSIIAATSKAAVTHYAKKIGKKNDSRNFSLGDVLGVAGILYQSSTSHADLRTWSSLPKEFQYASFDTPTDRQVTLYTPSHQAVTLTINPGKANVIYVKCVNKNSPLQISQFTLN